MEPLIYSLRNCLNRTIKYVTTVKTLFLSSLLISLRYKSVKGVSYTRTNISISGYYLIDILIEVR